MTTSPRVTSCRTSLLGDDGDDTISGGGALFGDLAGGRGDDLITGSTRRDSIGGGPGNDTISGRGGDDDLSPGSGDDVVDGGPGEDSVTFSYFAQRVDVSLRDGTASGQGADTLLGLEVAYGTNKADRLIGNAEDNFLNGGGGRDVLIGGRGTTGSMEAQRRTHRRTTISSGAGPATTGWRVWTAMISWSAGQGAIGCWEAEATIASAHATALRSNEWSGGNRSRTVRQSTRRRDGRRDSSLAPHGMTDRYRGGLKRTLSTSPSSTT